MDLEYNPSNKAMYVADSGPINSDDVSVIDSATNTVSKTIDVEGFPYDLEYNPSNKYIYVD